MLSHFVLLAKLGQTERPTFINSTLCNIILKSHNDIRLTHLSIYPVHWNTLNSRVVLMLFFFAILHGHCRSQPAPCNVFYVNGMRLFANSMQFIFHLYYIQFFFCPFSLCFLYVSTCHARVCVHMRVSVQDELKKNYI